MDFFRMMRGKTPSPYGKSPTPTPKNKTATPFYSPKATTPVNRVASRRVPMERSPTPPFHSARSSPLKKKRCPNGTRKNKKGFCVKRGSRCPNGTRKNRKSGKCESK